MIWERRVVKKSEIPRAEFMGTDKGYWEAVARHLRIIGPDEALAIDIPAGHVEGSRKSIHCAAARLGMAVSIFTRGTTAYTYLVSMREPVGARPERNSIRCAACGAKVVRPKIGGSVQFYCHATGGLTDCQVVGRMATRLKISLDEAKQRSLRWKKRIARKATA